MLPYSTSLTLQDASGDELKTLKMLERTFGCYIMESPEVSECVSE